MNSEDKVKQQFVNSGYVELPESKFPKPLLWRPNFAFSKNKLTYLVLVKTNNSIPPTFLNRLANLPSDKVIPLIVFPHRLRTQKEEKEILDLGISIGYFIRGKLSHLTIKRKAEKTSLKKEI